MEQLVTRSGCIEVLPTSGYVLRIRNNAFRCSGLSREVYNLAHDVILRGKTTWGGKFHSLPEWNAAYNAATAVMELAQSEAGRLASDIEAALSTQESALSEEGFHHPTHQKGLAAEARCYEDSGDIAALFTLASDLHRLSIDLREGVFGHLENGNEVYVACSE